MKKYITSMLLVVFALYPLHAEDAPAAPTAPVAPAAVETPAATENSADGGVFVTLTRTDFSRKDLPTNAEVLTPQDFQGWSPQTTGEAAQRMTSVQVNRFQGLGGAQTPQIRGANSRQNLVLVDGRPMGGISFSAFQDLTEVPVEQVDHIEIVRGGASALYGPNAMAGVINVITRRGPTDGRTIASAGYDYGSYGRNVFRASAGSKMGHVDYFAYGDTQHEQGFRDNSKADTVNAGLNLGIALPAASKLTVDFSDYQAEVGSPGRNFTPTNQFDNDIERRATTPNAKQNIETKALRLGYRVPLPMNSLLSLKAWGSDRQNIFKDDFTNADTMQSARGGSIQLDLPLGLVIGSDFNHDREDSTDYITPTNTFIAHTENYAFFAQDTMKWKAITLIPGGRFDHNSLSGDTANPRVQLMADAQSWLRFSGSTARSVRAPAIDDVFYPFTDFGTFANDITDPATRYTRSTYGGNPNLRPEKAWSYDAGFELHNDKSSFKATYFRSNVSNLIQNVELFSVNTGTLADPDVSAFTTINVGEARRQGLEIQMDCRMNEYFRKGLNYTYLQNVGKPFGFTDFVELSYSPRHTVNGYVTFSPTKSLDFTNTLRYVDSQYSGNDRTGSKLGSALLWDIRLAYRWQALETYFQVRNVTDRRYVEQAFYPLPGRTFIGGVSVRFGAK